MLAMIALVLALFYLDAHIFTCTKFIIGYSFFLPEKVCPSVLKTTAKTF